MALRMAEYMLHVWRLYGRFPRQIVLSVGDAPLRMVTAINEPAFSFSYELVDIRDLDAERLLDSPWVSDIVIRHQIEKRFGPLPSRVETKLLGSPRLNWIP